MMKIYKIYVQERKCLSALGELRYEEEVLQVFGELERDRETLVIQEYSREQKKLLRIGVYSEGAAQVVAKDSWGREIALSLSTTKPNIWYEATKGWLVNGYEERQESTFGSNACGEWKVIAYGRSGNILASDRVRIIPALLTLEQYRIMQMEVKKLFQELSYQPAEKDERAVIGELKVPLFPLEKFRGLLEDWKEWLRQIELTPAEILHVSREKKRRQLIKKWDAKAILEAVRFPHREKISVKTSIKEIDITEHQMIRWMLERVRERIEQERATEKSALLQLTEVRNGLEYINASQERNQKVMETLNKRKEQVQRDLKLLTDRVGVWEEAEVSVNGYLNSLLFDTREQEPEWTHLFTSHPLYRSVYEGYESIVELAPVLTPKQRDFEKAMINSPHLYEVWILLQLIYHLDKVKFTCFGVIDSLLNYFVENNTLSGWSGKFTSCEDTVGLYYEREFTLANGSKVKPDYILLFQKGKQGKWDAHSLDAKYKPYTLLDHGVLHKDIDRSGRRYLKIENNKIDMKSAALVHLDQEAGNWNIDPARIYSLSHFHVVPGQTEGLQIYLKRILHYFSGRVELCPSCGESVPCMDQNYKRTFICEHCNEVWVDNTCAHKNRLHPQFNVRLLKYPSGNFNVQVGNQWNVYCPVCSKDVNGQVIQKDLFGRTI